MLLVTALRAQSGHSSEQLQQQLRQTGRDTNRVRALQELGTYYLYKDGEFKTDLDSTFLYLQEAKNLDAAIRPAYYNEELEWLLASYYFEAKKPDLGKKICLTIIELYRKAGDKAREATALVRMAKLHQNDSTYKLSIYFFEQAIACYQQLGDKEKAAVALKEIADVHLNQGMLVESEKELLEVIDIYKSIGFRNLHYTYDLLAAVSTLRGNLNRALFYGLEMIKSMEATGDTASASTFCYRLARIYKELGHVEQSVEWFKKSFAKSKEYGVGANIINGLIQAGKTDEAFRWIQKLLYESSLIKSWEQPAILAAIGNYYFAIRRYDLAEKNYLEMVQRGQLEEGNDYSTGNMYFIIGNFYAKRYRYREAEPYLKKVLAMPYGIVTAQRLKDTHLLFFKIDSASGNYLAAIRHFQLHKQLNDSIFNDTKSKQIEELQIQYETEKKEKDIILLQNESALQQNKLQQATLAKDLTFGGSVLLLIILSLLYNRYRLKQRSNQQLEAQQTEINQTNRWLQNLLEDKELLLREIHHRVKNNLQIVMSLLNSQSVYLEKGTALTAIRDSQQRIHSISLIHQKLYQSQNITLIDMSVYIQELVEYLKDSFDTRQTIHFDLQTTPIELDVTKAVPLGLILNEAISNAIKYAFPDNRPGVITISMQHIAESTLALTIADDGVGLPEDFNIHKRSSLGMSLMRGLTKQLRGKFDLKSDNGLAITITFTNEKLVDSAAEPTGMELVT